AQPRHLVQQPDGAGEVARLGGAAGLEDRISALAGGTDSPLAAARAAHVRAMIADDMPSMESVAQSFEAVGARLNAAEAYVAAAELARGLSAQRSAAAFGLRAEQLLAHCEGAISPGLVTSTGSLQPLTEREREIAFMAVSGLTSRQIAGRLVLSQRTISNHLQHIYDKLGVRNREDLRRAMTGE
ncbi:MAG: helix-turn-helix transcriptional regulator, partial [Ilumatobacteraceae bacterium]